MKRTPIKRSTKGLRAVTPKTRERNAKWKQICLDRAVYLMCKYGCIVCEYSGEAIKHLSIGGDLDDGWGHHIDGDRNNCTPENCYIVKYRYHGLIEDKNITVKQEGFEGRK